LDLGDLIFKFQSTLPLIRKWIDDVLDGHKDRATPIINLGLRRLEQVFPSELLKKTKVVVVPGKLPFPSLSRMGLAELSKMEKMPMAGITYKDTFFVHHAHQSDRLHFHELVHVVQWERLGVDNYLLAYAVGLIQYGYRGNPLEEMAYDLEERFDDGNSLPNIVDFIGEKTDDIWSRLAPLFEKASHIGLSF
jgi:hypothetical protein